MANDGWIEWHGGNCPVAGSASVLVKFRSGEEDGAHFADAWRWYHTDTDDDASDRTYDIVAYRLLVDEQGATVASTADLISQFPLGVHLEITVVFPGQYRVGYRYQNVHYLPGTPSYYPLEEALQKCLDAFKERFSA